MIDNKNLNINIIISPAKKMVISEDSSLKTSTPQFIDSSKILYSLLQSFDFNNLKKLLCCNDDIAELNFERYKSFDFYNNLTPAVFAYEGIQYKYISPNTMTIDELNYLNDHLNILSGFYGILKASDGVNPYRLEMQARLSSSEFKNLYDFWGNRLYQNLKKENSIILNLASKEYSKCIEKYLTSDDTFITCIFGSLKDGKVRVKATEAKMARGSMVRYLAKNNVHTISKIKEFSDLGFSFSKEYSDTTTFVFLK